MDGLIERIDTTEHTPAAVGNRQTHVIIIGTGFGDLTAATHLKRAEADVAVID